MPIPRPNVKCSMSVQAMPEEAYLSTHSYAPMELFSTNFTSFATGGSISIAQRLRLCTH
jgi:hypothetical protein